MKAYLEPQRIYRNTHRRKVSGVCAGIAEHFKLEAWIVRIAAVVAFLMFPVPIAIAYALAVVVLPTKKW